MTVADFGDLGVHTLNPSTDTATAEPSTIPARLARIAGDLDYIAKNSPGTDGAIAAMLDLVDDLRERLGLI